MFFRGLLSVCCAPLLFCTQEFEDEAADFITKCFKRQHEDWHADLVSAFASRDAIVYVNVDMKFASSIFDALEAPLHLFYCAKG